MIKNYFKTAFRTFLKNNVITIITVLGLSVGISASLVIYQIVHYDYSFDKYEPDRDRIYRIVTENDGWNNSGVPSPLQRAVADQITGISAAAPFFQYDGWDTKISIPENGKQQPEVFKDQKDIVFADGNYFRIFPHQWLAGSPATSLNAPFQIVLSEKRARRYFPGLSVQQIIGKPIIVNDTLSTVVSGVVKDLTAHTDFNSKIFISLPTVLHTGFKEFFNWDQWNSINSVNQLFVKLAPGTMPRQVNTQLAAIRKAHADTDEQDKTVYRLQPLSDIHFNTDFGGSADKSVLRNLILLAIFLLLLGAINFINLSTAQATERAKEIGIRKTLGSTKGQLIKQFLTETFLLTFLAAVISLLILPFLLNIFSGYIPDGLKYGGIAQPDLLLFLFLLIVTISLLSGFYPALVLTRFKPVSVIRGRIISKTGQDRHSWIRRTLIVTQFIIAQVLIISVLSVNKQIHYALNKDMGFKQEGIITFYVPFNFQSPDDKNYRLRDRLRTLPGLSSVSLGNQTPAFNGTISTTVKYKDGKDEMTLDPYMRNGDTAFLRLYHIRLLAGRNVLPTDTATELLINEKLAHQLGFQHPQDALGKFLTFRGNPLPIVGVMANFNEASVRSAIQPMIYFSNLKYGYVMHVALAPGVHSWQKTIGKIKDTWQSFYPDKEFKYTFLDKTIESFYKKDIKLSRLLAWSAGIAIFIGCLGLLGLVIFMANQRTKEIGIRKVLGASIAQIIVLLSKDFMLLIGIAFVIAVPLAWILMNKWLQHFAYHTALSWWIFLLSGAAMFIFSLIILGIRAGKAARANPVDSLRSE